MDQEDLAAADLTRLTGIPVERQLMSGADKLRPGDAHSDRRVRNPSHKLFFEMKIVGTLTAKGQKVISIELDAMDQLLREAVQEHSLPVYMAQFRDDPRRFMVLRFEDLARLLAEHRALSEAVGDI